jgi:hypothetical protein
MTRKLSVLVVALICTFLFTSLVMAQEEPRAKPAKGRLALEERQPSIDQLFMKRSCKAPGKKGGIQRFGDDLGLNKEANSCGGWCDCNVCYCEYSDGDLGCCFDGCDGCWAVADVVLGCQAQ